MPFLSPVERDADSPPQGGDRSPEAHPTAALARRRALGASSPQLPPDQAPVARFLHQQFLALAVKLGEVLVGKVHLRPPPSIVPFGVARLLVRLRRRGGPLGARLAPVDVGDGLAPPARAA